MFQVLDKLRHFLCDNLQPERIIPWLQTKDVLSTDDCEYIRSFPTTKRKVDVLLDIVKSGKVDFLTHLLAIGINANLLGFFCI